MFKLTVKTTSKLADIVKELEQSIKESEIEFVTSLDTLADMSCQYMKDFISSHKSRSGSNNNLENNITVEVDTLVHGPSDHSWGIGSYDLLDDKAPYWHLINYGGLSLPAQVGMGVPGLFNGEKADPSKRGTGVGHDKFNWEWKTGMMFPTAPIEPMNYIEATEAYVVSEIDKLLINLKQG